MSIKYNYVRCEVCGVPWADHDPACANHRQRAARLAGYGRGEADDILPIVLANVPGAGAVPPVRPRREAPDPGDRPRGLFAIVAGLFGRSRA